MEPENANEDNDGVLSTPETFGTEETTPKDSYTGKSVQELYELLNEAVQNEDYEKAAKIRDEISKKNLK
ncbi:UvrB/UvrC motif-containing protein [Flavobacterium piscinae]|uniref:UvrB/UvrC motif-containing protein n=1 Tax=Flavobacterium piscinae TaxID=2506424 RepID=UPI003709C045